MTIDATQTKSGGKLNRRLRLGMVGGGPGGSLGRFIVLLRGLMIVMNWWRRRCLPIPSWLGPPRSICTLRPTALMAVSLTWLRPKGSGKTRSMRSRSLLRIICTIPLPRHFLRLAFTLFATSRLRTLEDALDLAQTVRRTGLLFGVTHNYTGHPMVRQARQMVADGELGPLRVVQVEYAQDWLSTPLEKTGQKQALWRTDPALSGPGGSLGDIGTHAFNLASFVTGLNCRELAAELTTFVPGRRVDDNVQIMLRFAEGARGLLWASQVASGNQNNLRLRVFGEKAGIEWRQEDPNYLWFAPLGKTPVVISRAGPGASPVAAHASRIPSGHAEGYLEAFAQLYTDMAEQISARIDGRAADPSSLLVPTVEDGVQGMRFIAAVIESSRQNAAWTPLPAAG